MLLIECHDCTQRWVNSSIYIYIYTHEVLSIAFFKLYHLTYNLSFPVNVVILVLLAIAFLIILHRNLLNLNDFLKQENSGMKMLMLVKLKSFWHPHWSLPLCLQQTRCPGWSCPLRLTSCRVIRSSEQETRSQCSSPLQRRDWELLSPPWTASTATAKLM